MSPYLAWFLMFLAIGLELFATSFLPATHGFTVLKPSLLCGLGYFFSFFCFGLCLEHINLGIAYATWSAVGTAATPFIGRILYKQKTSRIGYVGVFLIIIGVLMINLLG